MTKQDKTLDQAEAEIAALKNSGAHVFTAINNIVAALAKTGIAKSLNNTKDQFKARGIDDVYAALAPLLAEEKLIITPYVVSRTYERYDSKSGGTLFSITLEVEFNFVSCIDGTTHTVKIFSEAMDSGDKGTNKAMSAAYKYMALLTFCIPVVGDDDPDSDSHEVKSSEQKPAAKPSAPKATPKPNPLKDQARELGAKIKSSATVAQVNETWAGATELLSKLPPNIYADLMAATMVRIKELEAESA